MKTLVYSFLSLALLASPNANRVRAAETPLPSSSGKVLILKTKYTMEGDIERVGDRYRVRRNQGEMWVPAARVLTVTSSLTDAYHYLRGQINLGDPDERLSLARWCRVNNLAEQALAELQAADKLRPDHKETRRLLQHWQQMPLTALPKTAAKPKSDDEPPPVEVTTEALGLFVSRVQPILMNTCARCHANGHGGNFHLGQVFGDGVGNRRAMERNLAAALKQINLNQPDVSLLLTKAVSDHAHSGQAPLRDRQTPAYRTLEHWVKLTADNNPQLRDRVLAAPPSPPPVAPVEQPAKSGEESEWGAGARSKTAAAPGSLPSAPVPVPATPAKVDPYDPDVFNRQMHPEANKPEK
jgi:hypothetical protein